MWFIAWFGTICTNKKRENTHGGVLLSVKLQDKACKITKSKTSPWVFFMFFISCKWQQITQSIAYTIFPGSYALINPFQPSVAFHIETSYLICPANQMTGFCMKCNSGLRGVKPILFSVETKGKISSFIFFVFSSATSWYLFVQSQQYKQQNNVWSLFTVITIKRPKRRHWNGAWMIHGF